MGKMIFPLEIFTEMREFNIDIVISVFFSDKMRRNFRGFYCRKLFSNSEIDLGKYLIWVFIKIQWEKGAFEGKPFPKIEDFL